ncbi:uncharacterized protein LOC112565801 isoform X3 [Pomacea canaliculata]|uniref:uncharacterized protein LOC112565801 isoform X3 n=1 Tax=Pomacea canaliculata TaxID=400727 RepID=UPI000D73A754|nr:uncharacterized protein LOC112565801 isoform X3 [Pomacea canaliculata]
MSQVALLKEVSQNKKKGEIIALKTVLIMGLSGAVSGDQGASADIRGSNSTSAGSSGDDDDDDDEDNRNRQKHVDHKQEGYQRRKIKKNRQEEEEEEKEKEEEEEDNDSSFDRDGKTCQRDDLDDQFDVSRQLEAEHPMSRQLATRHPMSRQLATRHPMSRQLATRHPMFMSRQQFLLRQLATGHPMSRQQPTRHLTELILASNSPLWLLLFRNLFSTSSRWLQNLSIITVSPSAGPYVVWNNCYQTTLTEQLRASQNFSHATLTGLLTINHNCHSTLGLERIHIYFILTGQCRAGQNCCHAICTGPSGVCPVYWPAQLGCFYCEILWLLVGCLQSSFCPMQEEELSWHSLPSQTCFQFPLAEGSHTIWVSGWVSRETESLHVLCILPSVPSRTPSLESFSQFLARDSYPRSYSGTRSLLPHGHISMDTANSAIHNQQALSEMLLRVLAEISRAAPLASVLSNQALASNSSQCFQSEACRRNRCPQRVLRESCGEISAAHSSRHNERSVHMYNCGQDSIVNEVNAITAVASQEAASQQAVTGRQRTAQHEVTSLQAGSSHLVQHRDDEQNESQTLNQEVPRRNVHLPETEGRPPSFDGDDSSSDDYDGDEDDDSDGSDEDEAEADEDPGPRLIQQFRQPCLRIRGQFTVITTPDNDDEGNEGLIHLVQM